MTVKEISRVIDGKRVIVKKPELLIPAGNLEKLKIAIHYGADAVYLGGQEFGLRSNAGNFTLEEMAEAWISLANECKWRLGKESETKPQP